MHSDCMRFDLYKETLKLHAVLHQRNPPLVSESIKLIVRHAYTPQKEDELALSQPS